MAKALTAIAIAALKAKPVRYEISDPGCAGLRVVIFPSGRKSFVVRFRFKGQLQCKLTLGPCLTERGVAESETTPELDTPLSLAAARERATKALREAKSGSNPAAAKQRERQKDRAAESDTLSAIAAEYLRREGKGLRSVRQRSSDLDLICASLLGRLPVGEITRGQLVRLFDRIADERGPVRSDRCLSALRTLLGWHARRSDFVSPLVPGMRRTSIAERARTRILSDDELRRVWTAAEQDKGLFGSFVRFLLLSAARRSEAAALTRSELSDGGKTWTIPGARYKTGRDVVIPLSAAAQQVIAAQPVLAGSFVFSANGSRPLGGFDQRKKLFDQLSGVSGYGLHDLRRTARTLLSRAGVSADIAEMCLGHAFASGVRGVYDRYEYADQKRAAFEALSALITRIAYSSSTDVVVPLGRRK
jgi:integrase